MNRQQRRQKQKQERRIQKAGAFQLDMEALTPWADVLIKLTINTEV